MKYRDKANHRDNATLQTQGKKHDLSSSPDGLPLILFEII